MQEQYLAVIKQIIEDNIDNENFSVADLAREAGLSRSMLHRKLIRLTGKSATDLITEIRLKKAFELLENDAGTVSEIAYMVGYSSPSYFNKVFKKTYKVSPGDVRRKGRGKIPHLRVVKEPGVPVSARSKRSRSKVIPTTNILMIIIVTLGALALIPGVVDGISSILRLPEWAIYLIVLILIVGFIIVSILYWIYDIRRKGGILKTDSSELVEPEDIPRSSKLRKIATYASFLVIIVLLVMTIFSGTFQSAKLSNLQKSVAVLPMRYLSNDSTHIHWCSGMQDEILGHLSRISALSVKSKSSTERYKDSDKTSKEIGEELQANFLIDCSFAFEKNEIKVWIQLIVAETDEHLWANEYQKELSDIFTVQSEISKAIARELKVVLTPEEIINIDKNPTDSLEAYNQYLIGNYLHNQHIPDSYRKAIDHFQKAVALDPGFAEAYCNLAFSYFNLMGWFATPSKDYMPEVKSNVLKALELDNKLGEAYYMLGCINFLYEWDWDEAEKNFSKGLNLNPDYIQGRVEYANFLASMRRLDEATRITNGTIELDPLNPVVYNELSFSLWIKGETEQALVVIDESLKLNPDHRQTVWGSMTLNAELGNYNKALSIWKKLKGNSEISEIPAYPLAYAGQLMEYAGRRDEAISFLNELNRRADEEGYKDTYPQALINITIGDHEKALELLEQAFINRNFAMAQMNVHKTLDPLRSYDRFQNIIEKMNFP